MSIEFNHTLVRARNPGASAEFLAEILGLPEPSEYGPFQIVKTDNDVNVDFMQSEGEIASQHYAFLVSEAEFDEIFARIEKRKSTFWADPAQNRKGEINHKDNGRGVYFKDPDGHMLEVLTRPYGSGDIVKVEETIGLSVAPEKVWERVGAFEAVGDWHPMLDSVKCQGNHVGAIRTVTGDDGSRQVERLISYEDTACPYRYIEYTYVMQETGMPVADYRATFRVEASGEGSRVRWIACFRNTDGEDNAEDMVRGFIRAGLKALPDYLSQ